MSSRSRSEPEPAPSRPAPVAIRRAVRADAATLAALARELNRHQGEPVRWFTARAVLRDGFGRKPAFVAFLAERAGAAVGYALLVGSYETGWAERGLYLQDLYVREAARKAGVGRALLAAAAAEAVRRGGDYLWVTAKGWNRRAHGFYRATGAVEEKIMAYAWTRATFAALARRGEAAAPLVRRARPGGRRGEER